MPLDPQFRSVIDQATAAGALPLVQATAQETRSHYRSLAVSRRGADFVPEPVAKVVDDAVDGPAGPVPVRVYTPTGDRGRVITYLHGGGWVVGDLDTHDPVCRRVANAVGATVVAVDYRLAPEHPYPAPLDDAMAALAWTADRYPGLPHVVAGDSAGASLAAGAALRARDGNGPALAAQLLVYPATDPSMSTPSMRDNGEGYFLTRADMAWFYDQYLPDRARRGEPHVDLLHAPDLAGLPPAVVATAEFDPLRDEGDAYAQRLRAAGVAVRHVPGPGLIHGYFAFLGVVAEADARSREVLAALDDLLP
ncbi:MAG TPA: alpha/beta hydrolase [Pseudonocardia sp.]|uniref:alpha/beta hydrolase n=1 Tax=Pseudonocardia sp. TaxID=60912 RepID=UPI002B4B3C91|nr:alpha/beta hydrolase [Pseudonocardia sp.]HLU60328.1 alpha/beta hydrolase [Pseudonocardia sp.]